jgi:hypothetical protein
LQSHHLSNLPVLPVRQNVRFTRFIKKTKKIVDTVGSLVTL